MAFPSFAQAYATSPCTGAQVLEANFSGAPQGGGGRVSKTRIDSGAILAPGGVGATLMVDGDLTITPGGTYQVYAYPSSAHSTRIKVTGAVLTYDGTVMHSGPNGAYLPGIDYTIIIAGKGMTGKFASVESGNACLRPILTYTPTMVTMELEQHDAPSVLGM
jgi:fibronectin-binding autotransporter adhesin